MADLEHLLTPRVRYQRGDKLIAFEEAIEQYLTCRGDDYELDNCIRSVRDAASAVLDGD